MQCAMEKKVHMISSMFYKNLFIFPQAGICIDSLLYMLFFKKYFLIDYVQNFSSNSTLLVQLLLKYILAH